MDYSVNHHASLKDVVCLYLQLKIPMVPPLHPGMELVMPLLLLLHHQPAYKAVALKILMKAEGDHHHPLPVVNPHHILHLHLCATDTRLSLGLSQVSMHQHIVKVLKQGIFYYDICLINLKGKTAGIVHIYYSSIQALCSICVALTYYPLLMILCHIFCSP